MSLMYDKAIEENDTRNRGEKEMNTSNTPNKKRSKISQYFKEHKAVGLAAMILSAVLLFVIVMMITISAMKGGDNAQKAKEITIPNAVKMSQEENKSITDIEEYIKSQNLKVEVIEDYDAEIEAGKVIKQEPVAGLTYDGRNKTVRAGDTIKVWVSKGQKLVNVPDLLVGKKKEEVVTAIEGAELKVEIVEENSDKMESGKVIKVEPAEKTEVSAGSVVKVYVSIGLEQKEVPNLVGKTEEEAKSAITAAGLKWKRTDKKSDSSKPNNTIISQDIVAGSVVDKDTEITITLNEFDEIKTGSINVNVSTLLGYTAKNDEEGNLIKPNSVSVVLILDGSEYATKETTEDSSNCSFSIDSTGSKPVSIQIKSKTGTVLVTRSITYSAGETRNIA